MAGVKPGATLGLADRGRDAGPPRRTLISRAELIERLAAAVLAVERTHPTRVAVDGPDAAGKTTLADELAAALAPAGREIIRASIDGFHRPRADRYRQGADSARGYYEDSFDHDALRRALLEPLGPGGDRRYRTAVFDFRTDSTVEAPVGEAAADAVLVLDGVFLQRPELCDGWELAIFVAVEPEECLRRALERDLDSSAHRKRSSVATGRATCPASCSTSKTRDRSTTPTSS